MYTKELNVIVVLLVISGIFGLDSSEFESSGETSSSHEKDGDNDISDEDEELPENLVPHYYKLDFIPFLEPEGNFTINGKVSIDVKCTEPTNIIYLHGVNLIVKKETVKVIRVAKPELPLDTKGIGSTKFPVTRIKYDNALEIINITVKSHLKVGQFYRISMEYLGKVRDDFQGFYKRGYFDTEKNATRYVGITQFKHTNAPMAFPCFDEPHLKAKFEISLGRRTDMSSMCNTNLRKTEPMQGMEGWVWDHYDKSPPMSSYMVAFGVSEFEYVEVQSNDKLEFRVWARKDVIGQTEYAKTLVPKMMTFYEDYFGVKYQMQKIDVVAIPEMSNAFNDMGMLTYGEKHILYDANVTTERTKMDVALSISHGLAYQWTKNLSESDMELDKGFTQYMQYIGLDHISPEWNIFQHFMSSEMHKVFVLDSLPNSHPFDFDDDDEHLNENNEIFDDIIYHKGASLIRMTSHFLTESTFKKGLLHYLKNWKGDDQSEDDDEDLATQNDLWHSLTKQAHADGTLDDTMTVDDIMEHWTLEKCYPVITVVRNYTDGSVTFSQTKFQLHKNSMNTSYEEILDDDRWWVPISTVTSNSNQDFLTSPTTWLSNNEASSTFELDVDSSAWLIVNAQQTGYYRVNYDTKNWDLIISQLTTSHKAIHVINRAQIIDDTFNLARAGQLSYEIVFKLTKYVTNEFEPLPWSTLLANFHFMDDMLSNSTAHETFKHYVRKLLKKQLDHVGYSEKNSDSHQTKLHRMEIVDWACHAEYTGCLQHASEIFARWMNQSNPDDDNPISKNLRETIYKVAINSGGKVEWDFLWKRYLQKNFASEQKTILTALGYSKDPWLLNRYLNWTTSAGHGIPKKYVNNIFSAVASHPIGNSVAFKFIRENALQMKYYLKSSKWVYHQVEEVASYFKTDEQLQEFKNLVGQHANALGSSSSKVNSRIESIKANILWSKDNFEGVSKWIEDEIKV